MLPKGLWKECMSHALTRNYVCYPTSKGNSYLLSGSWLTLTVAQPRWMIEKWNIIFRKHAYWISPTQFIALFYLILQNLSAQVYSRNLMFWGVEEIMHLGHHTFINAGRQVNTGFQAHFLIEKSSAFMKPQPSLCIWSTWWWLGRCLQLCILSISTLLSFWSHPVTQVGNQFLHTHFIEWQRS